MYRYSISLRQFFLLASSFEGVWRSASGFWHLCQHFDLKVSVVEGAGKPSVARWARQCCQMPRPDGTPGCLWPEMIGSRRSEVPSPPVPFIFVCADIWRGQRARSSVSLILPRKTDGLRGENLVCVTVAFCRGCSLPQSVLRSVAMAPRR